MRMNREMRRKAQRDWSYDQYAKSRSTRVEKERMQRCMSLASADWKREVSLVVPKWLQIASLFVPPKWYIDSIKWVSKYLPPQSFITWVLRLKLSSSVRWAIMFPALIPAIVLEWTAVRPFIAIRRMMRTFGVTTDFRPVSKEVMRMTIRHFFFVIYEKEYTV